MPGERNFRKSAVTGIRSDAQTSCEHTRHPRQRDTHSDTRSCLTSAIGSGSSVVSFLQDVHCASIASTVGPPSTLPLSQRGACLMRSISAVWMMSASVSICWSPNIALSIENTSYPRNRRNFSQIFRGGVRNLAEIFERNIPTFGTKSVFTPITTTSPGPPPRSAIIGSPPRRGLSQVCFTAKLLLRPGALCAA